MGMPIDPDDPSCGALTMDRTEGLVYRRRPDETLELLGFIEDDDACPDGFQAEWAQLRDFWRDSGAFARACEAEAYRGWYDRLAIARLN